MRIGPNPANSLLRREVLSPALLHVLDPRKSIRVTFLQSFTLFLQFRLLFTFGRSEDNSVQPNRRNLPDF